jgi:hypothetical protein
MSKMNRNRKIAILIIFLGTLFTILFGYLLKFLSIFNPADPGFQFVIYGLCGSFLLAVIHTSNTKNFIYGILALLLITVVLFRIKSFSIIMIRLLFWIALSFAIFLYHRCYYKDLNKLAFGKFIPLSALMFIASFAVAVIFGFYIKSPDFKELLFGQASYGFIIGTGIGLGLELYEPIGKLVKFL